MTLSTEQILQLAKGSDALTVEVVLVRCALADRVKNLAARIEKLESEQTQKSVAKIRAVV
jgi:hypothetical protein